MINQPNTQSLSETRSLQIVDTSPHKFFTIVIDRLERNVLAHINTQAQAGEMLDMNHLRKLFFETKILNRDVHI